MNRFILPSNSCHVILLIKRILNFHNMKSHFKTGESPALSVFVIMTASIWNTWKIIWALNMHRPRHSGLDEHVRRDDSPLCYLRAYICKESAQRCALHMRIWWHLCCNKPNSAHLYMFSWRIQHSSNEVHQHGDHNRRLVAGSCKNRSIYTFVTIRFCCNLFNCHQWELSATPSPLKRFCQSSVLVCVL